MSTFSVMKILIDVNRNVYSDMQNRLFGTFGVRNRYVTLIIVKKPCASLKLSRTIKFNSLGEKSADISLDYCTFMHIFLCLQLSIPLVRYATLRTRTNDNDDTRYFSLIQLHVLHKHQGDIHLSIH